MDPILGFLFRYKISLIATGAALLLGWIVTRVGDRVIRRSIPDGRQQYSARSLLNTAVVVIAGAAIFLFWAKHFQHTGTVVGLIGAGLAVALREPLLSIAGRVAIFAGHMYTVGDRIEIEKMSGDVIDVGPVYTRMMEIGNWITGDQYSGRIIQFPNAMVFGNAVMNYTRNFEYIWDEVHLSITYDSNIDAARDILLNAGTEYTKEFLQGAERQLAQMQRYFLVPNLELKPHVYFKVTTNWVGLTMRYVVDPKKRRSAATFLYDRVFKRIRERDDISIGSDTMDVTVRQPETPHSKEERRASGDAPAAKRPPDKATGERPSVLPFRSN